MYWAPILQKGPYRTWYVPNPRVEFKLPGTYPVTYIRIGICTGIGPCSYASGFMHARG